MYAIRVDQGGRRLAIHCSERLTTGEALRIINHAAVLCDAGKINEIVCDARDVDLGPGRTLQVAIAIAHNLRAGQRLAILMRADQQRMVQRIVRFSGQSQAVRAFTEPLTLEAWLSGNRDEFDQVRTPNGRHFELITASPVAKSAAEKPKTRAAG